VRQHRADQQRQRYPLAEPDQHGRRRLMESIVSAESEPVA
jgi:hypothetical protein